jgi:hypothetical protein
MIYKEKTYFNRFISIPLFFPLVYCISEIFSGLKSNDLTKIIIFSIITIFSLTVVLVIIFSNLKIIFFEEYLVFELKPFLFKKKRVNYSEINSFELITIDPLNDFNGWGVRKSKSFGKGYITDTNKILLLNIKGNLLSLSVKNDEKVNSIMTNLIKNKKTNTLEN